MIRAVTVVMFGIWGCCPLIQARTLNEIPVSGVLRVGVPGDYAPLAWRNATTGKLQGFEIDLVNDFARSQKTHVSFIPTSWPGLSNDLKSGKFDLAIGGITATQEREKSFYLSKGFLPNGKIAVSHCKASHLYSSLEKIDKAGVRVAVNPGGTNQSFVEQHIHHAQIIRMKNNLDTIQAIRSQTADVMFTDLLEGKYYHNTEPEILCITTSQPFNGTESRKVWMMNKTDPGLLNAVNSFIKQERLSALSQKWNILK